jgi:hypothetical protein
MVKNIINVIVLNMNGLVDVYNYSASDIVNARNDFRKKVESYFATNKIDKTDFINGIRLDSWNNFIDLLLEDGCFDSREYFDFHDFLQVFINRLKGN